MTGLYWYGVLTHAYLFPLFISFGLTVFAIYSISEGINLRVENSKNSKEWIEGVEYQIRGIKVATLIAIIICSWNVFCPDNIMIGKITHVKMKLVRFSSKDQNGKEDPSTVAIEAVPREDQ